MKKIMTLLAVLLFGTASVFAQWDVDVTWGFTPSSDCHTQLTSQHGFRVTLEIKDTANDSIVSTPVQSDISWTATGTNFDGNETKVEDYCDGNQGTTPIFRVIAHVEIYHLSTYNIICDKYSYDTGISCSEFNIGVALPEITFN